jgi:cytosine/adenosine deaminase-related metal-dependent hydrolase
MAYRKFSADNLFTGYEMLGKAWVLITDETGKVDGIVDLAEAGEGIENLTGTLTPGFVNCHCHLELSHLKGLIPKGTGMVPFLLAIMNNRNFPSASDEIAEAEKKMLECGIVAVGDICNTSHTVAQKQQENIHYHNFIEATGFVDATAAPRFGQALEVCEKFDAAMGLKSDSTIVPHAPYSVSSNLFGLIDKHEKNSLLTIHNQESYAENELFQHASGEFLELYKTIGIDISAFKKTGKTSIQSYLNKMGKHHSMILVHNTVTSQQDLDWVLDNKSFLPELSWCICPNANLYINNMLTDVPMLKKAGCKIVVGTDSLASNDQLNIIEELKTLQVSFPSFPISELLKWATINGAEALRINDKYGSFDKGKTPGVVLVENILNGSLLDASSVRIL